MVDTLVRVNQRILLIKFVKKDDELFNVRGSGDSNPWTSVTRWLDYLFNIAIFYSENLTDSLQKFAKVGFEILPNTLAYTKLP